MSKYGIYTAVLNKLHKNILKKKISKKMLILLLINFTYQ